MKDSIVSTQFYAGKMANTIGQLLALKDRLRKDLLENGYSPLEADAMTEKIYLNAWEYINKQGY